MPFVSWKDRSLKIKGGGIHSIQTMCKFGINDGFQCRTPVKKKGRGEGRSKPSMVILTSVWFLKVWLPCYWSQLSLRKLAIHSGTEGNKEMTKRELTNRNVNVYVGKVTASIK